MRIIGGTFKGRRLHPPASFKARPTTDLAREGLFNILHYHAHIPGASVLDLFCGTGAVSIEFVSRGAAAVVAIDIEPASKSFITATASQWGIKTLRVVRADVFKLIAKANEAFDIVFADPPYADPRFNVLPSMILASRWLKPGGLLVLEHSDRNSYHDHPAFYMHRSYGGVNFSLFKAHTGEAELN